MQKTITSTFYGYSFSSWGVYCLSQNNYSNPQLFFSSRQRHVPPLIYLVISNAHLVNAHVNLL